MRTLTTAEFLRQASAQPAGEAGAELQERVARILAAVMQRGDEAVAEYTQALDGVRPRKARFEGADLEAAWRKTAPALKAALKQAHASIAKFQRQIRPPASTRVTTSPGVTVRLEWRPLTRVMAYAPGGRAAYPSTVLMTVTPARIAGVKEVYVASPPQSDGKPAPLVMAAAHLAGADAVYAVGGAQAVAAFAYGTQSVPRVDKIVGPGNAYVAEAKRQVVGAVGIDGLAGPSELAILADASADPEWVAVDLAAQAEHDPQARALVVVPDAAYARRVEEAVARVVEGSGRSQILATSLKDQGLIVVAGRAEDRLRVVEAAAPEHVQLMVKDPARYTKAITAAGTIFDGRWTPAPLGDYVTGANHVLPTGRTARWAGPLGVHDFLKAVVLQRAGRDGIRRIGPAAVTLAQAEGLPAHAESVRRRLDA